MHLSYFAMTKYSARFLRALLIALAVSALTPTTDSRATAVADEWDEVFDTRCSQKCRIRSVLKLRSKTQACASQCCARTAL